MAGDRGIRASDADRERIAAALGGHYAAGRLTLGEFQERLDQAYAAKTLGQLDELMADLPGTDLGQLQRTDSGQVPVTDLGRLPGTDLGRLPGTDPGRLPGTDPGRLPGTDPGRLPGTDLGRLPGTGGQLRGPHAPGTVQAPDGRRATLPAFWLAITATTAVIWLISVAIGETWLLWIAVPVAFIMLRGLIVGGGGHHRAPR